MDISPDTVTRLLDVESGKNSKQAHFQPFTWLVSDLRNGDRQLLERAKDALRGAAVISELIEQSELGEADGKRLLAPCDCSHLQRFVISSCHLAADEIDRHFDWLHDQTTKKGRKQ